MRTGESFINPVTAASGDHAYLASRRGTNYNSRIAARATDELGYPAGRISIRRRRHLDPGITSPGERGPLSFARAGPRIVDRPEFAISESTDVKHDYFRILLDGHRIDRIVH
jgi:hypothetical protein